MKSLSNFKELILQGFVFFYFVCESRQNKRSHIASKK